MARLAAIDILVILFFMIIAAAGIYVMVITDLIWGLVGLVAFAFGAEAIYERIMMLIPPSAFIPDDEDDEDKE